MEDIEDLLLEMEEELNRGKKSLFGSGVTVDGEVMFSLIDRIRNSLPEVIQEARYLISSEERRKNEDTAKAQNIILTAQKRAEEILSEHNIITQAEREALAIRNQVQEYRERVHSEIRRDIATLLNDTEKTLTSSLDIIKAAQNSNNRNL